MKNWQALALKKQTQLVFFTCVEKEEAETEQIKESEKIENKI